MKRKISEHQGYGIFI
jgi:hypothetical protein